MPFATVLHRRCFEKFSNIFKKTPTNRSSCPDVICKKGALRNFAKFTEKYLCQSLFSNKVAGLRLAELPHVVHTVLLVAIPKEETFAVVLQ